MPPQPPPPSLVQKTPVLPRPPQWISGLPASLLYAPESVLRSSRSLSSCQPLKKPLIFILPSMPENWTPTKIAQPKEASRSVNDNPLCPCFRPRGFAPHRIESTLLGSPGPHLGCPPTSCQPLSLPTTDILAHRDVLSSREMLDSLLQ